MPSSRSVSEKGGVDRASRQGKEVADAELGRDPGVTFRTFLAGLSGETAAMPLIPPGHGLLDVPAKSDMLAPWLTVHVIGAYVAQYAGRGSPGRSTGIAASTATGSRLRLGSMR